MVRFEPCRWVQTGEHDPWCRGHDGRIRPRSAGAHWIRPPEPEIPTLRARDIVAAGLAAVGIILGVAWFLTAFPVPA